MNTVETSHVGVEPTASGLEVQRSSTKLMTLEFLINISSKVNFIIPSLAVPHARAMTFRSSWRRLRGW
jgi:hypothetical protein